MKSTNSNLTDEQNGTQSSIESQISELQTPKTSATTADEPSFGWSAYAERVNGRFAMIGFTAILIIEALSNQSFLKWAGLLG